MEACRENPPLAFAGGHEHTLEVLRGDVVPNLFVSGAGFYGHTNATKWRPETRYQKAASGFLRLDFMRSGEVRLGVLLVDERGNVEEPFAVPLINTRLALELAEDGGFRGFGKLLRPGPVLARISAR